MATSTTVSTAGLFADGATVGAYPVSNWPNGTVNQSAAPVGSATATGTVSSGSVTISGLADNTAYALAVSGGTRYTFVDTGDETPGGSVTESELDAHESDTTTHGISTFGATLVDDTSARAAATTLGTPYVLGKGGVAVPHTGNTTETALATVAVPAGAMGANGLLRVTLLSTHPNNANNKTIRVRLGGVAGTAFSTSTVTTSVAQRLETFIWNRNAANSQIGGLGNGSISASGVAIATAAIDTTAAQDLVITGQLGNGADTITLEGYVVELIHGA